MSLTILKEYTMCLYQDEMLLVCQPGVTALDVGNGEHLLGAGKVVKMLDVETTCSLLRVKRIGGIAWLTEWFEARTDEERMKIWQSANMDKRFAGSGRPPNIDILHSQAKDLMVETARRLPKPDPLPKDPALKKHGL